MTYTEDEIKLLIKRLREKAVKKDTPLSCSGDMYGAADALQQLLKEMEKSKG
ncbi:MAG: hypothetical protein LIP12_00135 [Clostridiales bacterium]|nr:hypothetical protein [Clostridiales bacterium]